MRRSSLLSLLAAFLLLFTVACSGTDDASTTDDTATDDTAADDTADDAAGDDATDDAADEPTDDPADEATDDTDEATEDDEADDAAADGEPIVVGIVTSTSGLLGGFGEQYLAGLEAGMDYATDGTRAVNGRPIELEIVDDGGDAEQAITAATDLVGQGVTILAGTVSSGVATQIGPFAEENDVLYISGPAASDAITGLNSHTFRSGRQSFQ
ncbi:MAG: ABC transporter substrate-binding protein, partial [Actinomycetota bacterium]